EVDQLQRELNIYTECTRADPVADSSRDPGTNHQTERHSSVEIISIRSESEDEIASYNKEDQVFHIKNNLKMDDTFAFQHKDLQKELLDAKYIIEEMECEQLLLIDEMNILQKKNLQYVELLGKKDPEGRLQETSDRGPQDTYLLTDGSADITRDLEQARILNKRYLNDQKSQNFHQNEFEQVCQQVEVETANTILLLQEELAKFQENINFLSKENSRLRNIIGTKDDEFRMSTEKWEKALLELTSFLVDGCRSLEDASEHIGSIANSFPEKKGLISDQVERAANCFLEKERTIVKLQNSLEDAQRLGQEMMLKLSSLKGATIAITEIQQLETDDSSREVIKLHTLLSEKMAKIEELERKFKNEEQILEAVQQMAPQLEPSELRLEKSEAGGSNGTEVQHVKLSDAILFGEEKIKMADSFFCKFEEAQATIEDADTMLNALLTANDNAKIMTSMWKQAAEDLMMERVDLIEEVQQFKSSLCLKEGEYESMHAQIHSSLAEIALSVTSLEESFLQMQSDVEKSFKVVYSDIFSLGQDLLGFICKSRSSMEDIWTEIMENGFASFVLYQCYAEKLSERISSYKLDSDAFYYRQKNCYSILKNVGKGFTSATGEKSVLKDTNNIEECHTENLQHKVCGLGHVMEVIQSVAISPKSEEEEMGLDPDSLIFNYLSLKRELARKDVLLKGLLFDISLLQESTSSSMDIKDETEEMLATLIMVRNELGVKTTQLDETLLKQRELETKLVDCNAAICISNSKLEQANEAIEMLSKKNSDLIIEIDNLKVKKNIAEDQLEEQKDVVKGLEKEILRLASCIEEKEISSIEYIEDDLRRVTAERDHLQEEVVSLNDRLEMAKALVDENEALAVEARQESEASKVYAEQKEEEATILEHSVEELERTINVLEKKVYDMGSEVERHYMRRNDLEVELEALRLRMLSVENSTENMDSQGSDFGLGNYQTSRLSVVRAQDLEESKEQIRVLEKDRADMAREIKECREYISELVLHAEAQALQYQQKYKTLETMVRELKTDFTDSSFVPPQSDIIEKSSMRTRGSSSPFRCIASLVQQMKIEKDQEMSVAKLKIEELQALACSRQKEVCVLNARLAAAENMTHDVIRDLLGVKLDMTNYANLVDQHQVQNLVEEAQQQTEKYFAKEQENLKLRKKTDELTEEIQSCIEEINQKETDILAAHVRLEQLQQRDQMLTTQNEMLKMDKLTLKRKIAEMDELLKRNYRPLSVQQQIQQPNKNKENSFLRCSNEELTKKLTKSDKLLSRLNDELAWYTKSDSSDPNNRKESGL
ncbi:Kinesin-like protein kin-12c, partial [Thalictrum thalictroides]